MHSLAQWREEGAPFVLLTRWREEAERTEPGNPGAAQLATVDHLGNPNVRTVLVRELGHEGLVFYTNLDSPKSREIAQHPKAALIFYWKSLARQVRIRGTVSRVDDDTADEYFAGRPRGSQLGAHASKQSEPLDDVGTLARRLKEMDRRFEGGHVPRPPNWSGFLIRPTYVEFWQERPHRLHDRLAFLFEDGIWRASLLYP